MPEYLTPAVCMPFTMGQETSPDIQGFLNISPKPIDVTQRGQGFKVEVLIRWEGFSDLLSLFTKIYRLIIKGQFRTCPCEPGAGISDDFLVTTIFTKV